MRRRRHAPPIWAATQHGVITAAQCRDLGVTRKSIHGMIAPGAWIREGPSVYRIAGAPRTWWQARAVAAVLSTGPGALASHRMAAHLWGLEGFPAPGRIEVTVARHVRATQ